MAQDYQAILCPYCGHTQRRMDRCEVCGGGFDPVSRRGVSVNMGPWYLHDSRVPFRPGFSYGAMKRLIAAGKVTAETIIRGPSTQQLWAPTRLTPGLSHLVGHCPRCEADVPPDAAGCPQCEHRFETNFPHNELGLPFTTAAKSAEAQAELDREVARSGGRSRALKLWQNPDVPMLALCPYCGEWQKNHDRCGSCGGVFDQLSQRATVIAMGPWFVRNKRFPHLPGCSYAVLRKQIETSRLDADAIIRGPTTRQFWAVAKHVPGVSHLLGFCWSCGKIAGKSDAKCGACGSPFGGVDSANGLGLPFATEEEAGVAERELQAQFNPLMPPTPLAPPPVPVKPAELGAGVSHAAVGQAAFSGLDRASLAVLAAARIEEPAAPPVAEEPRPPAAPIRRNVISRPRLRRANRSHPLIVAGLVALLTGAAVTGIILVANSREPEAAPSAPPGGAVVIDQPGSDGVKPTPPVTTNPPATLDATVIKEKTLAMWLAVRDTGRDGQVGLELDNLSDLIARADGLFADGMTERAATLYGEAMTAIEALQPRLKERDEATAARSGAARLLVMVDPTELPDVGIQLIDETKLRFDEAQLHFDNGEFIQARDLWKNVESGLLKLPERARGLAMAEAARKEYLATLDPDLDDATLRSAGGEAWREVAGLIATAARAQMAEQWSEASEAYRKAAALAPAVVKAVKPVALRSWSIQAGLHAARACAEHVDGETLDPRARTALRPMLVRLKVPMGPIDQATLHGIKLDELRKLALTDLAAEIAAAHGGAIEQSFVLGTHLGAIAGALKSSDGKLGGGAVATIDEHLPQLKPAAERSGVGHAVATFHDAFAKVGDLTDADAADAARKLCGDLVAKLSDLSQLSKLLSP